MNKPERIELLRAMDLLARSCNDERVIDYWLTEGIADGSADSDRELDFYTYDDNLAEVMDAFLETMHLARENGGLYCDGLTNDPEIIDPEIVVESNTMSDTADFISRRFNKVI